MIGIISVYISASKVPMDVVNTAVAGMIVLSVVLGNCVTALVMCPRLLALLVLGGRGTAAFFCSGE